MRATFRPLLRNGSSLVELMAAISGAAVVIIGVFCAVTLGNARATQLSLTYGTAASNIQVGIAGIGYHIRQGVNHAGRRFIIYSSRSGMAPIADGYSGGCLHVPYPNASDDVYIYAEEGALKVERVAGGTEEVLVASGVNSVSFTAEMGGSPLARTGSVQYALSTSLQHLTGSLSCSEFPRNW